MVRIACRLWIPGAEHQSIIGKTERITHIEPLCLSAFYSIRNRHYIFTHSFAESVDVVPVVAVARHSVITELYKIAETQFLTHPVAYLNQPVIKTVQLVLIILVPSALCFPRGKSYLIISSTLEWSDLRNSIHLSHERYLSACQKLLILRGEIILLL